MAASQPGRQGHFLKFVNLLTYFAFLGANFYTLSAPEDVYCHRKETYFTPACWVYGVLPVIQLLLLGTIVYQFSSNGKWMVIDCISWRLPPLFVLSAAYLAVWSQKLYLPAFVLALFASGSVSQVYYVIKKKQSISGDELWLNLPFSAFHGFMSSQVLISAFEAFSVDATLKPVDYVTAVLVVIAFLIINGTTTAFAWSRTEGNIMGSGVITLFTFAIYSQQTSSSFVHLISLVFGILSLIPVGKSLIGYLVKYVFESWRNAFLHPWRFIPFPSFGFGIFGGIASWRPPHLGLPFIGERTPLLGGITKFPGRLFGKNGEANGKSGGIFSIPKVPFFGSKGSSGSGHTNGESSSSGRIPTLGDIENTIHNIVPPGIPSVPSIPGQGAVAPVLGHLDSLRHGVVDGITSAPTAVVGGVTDGANSILGHLDTVRKTVGGLPAALEGGNGDKKQSGIIPGLPQLPNIGSIVKLPSGAPAAEEGGKSDASHEGLIPRLPNLGSVLKAPSGVPAAEEHGGSKSSLLTPNLPGLSSILHTPASAKPEPAKTEEPGPSSGSEQHSSKPSEEHGGLMPSIPGIPSIPKVIDNVPGVAEGKNILGRFRPFG